MLTKTKIAGVLVALGMTQAGSAMAVEQVMLGQTYAFDTSMTGTCPGMHWHTYVDGDRSVTGVIHWGPFKAGVPEHSVNITGTLAADDSFKATAKEVGGPYSAVITGKVANGYLTITMDGTGTGCDKQTWKIQRAPGYVSGGGG